MTSKLSSELDSELHLIGTYQQSVPEAVDLVLDATVQQRVEGRGGELKTLFAQRIHQLQRRLKIAAPTERWNKQATSIQKSTSNHIPVRGYARCQPRMAQS